MSEEGQLLIPLKRLQMSTLEPLECDWMVLRLVPLEELEVKASGIRIEDQKRMWSCWLVSKVH